MKPLSNIIHQKKLWGFDIETYGNKNKFLMGSIVGDDNVDKVFWNQKEMIDFILSHYNVFCRGYICATNLQFDILSLLKGTEEIKKMFPIIKNSSFLCAKIPVEKKKREYIYFIDSWNYYKFSVEKMGSYLKIPKLAKPDFLGKFPKESQKDYLQEYNKRDSLITYKFMKFLQENFNNMNCQMRLTSASTSLDLYRRNYQDFEFRKPGWEILKYLYNGYYGGRTEIFKRGKIRNVNYYDINSLYPSVMVNEFPKPTRFEHVRYLREDCLLRNEGVMHVKLKAPNAYVPYLPYRMKFKDSFKLVFPTGIFEGYYSFFEIREAIKLDYEIIKIYDAVVYFEKFYPFKDYVNTLYGLRKSYRKNNDMRQLIIKLFLNSLYGKFAQKIEYREFIVHDSQITYDEIKKHENIFRSGEWWIIRKKYREIPQFVNPILSIYTTAYARHSIFQHMKKVGFNVMYTDTDSLFTPEKMRVSPELGDMKLCFNIKKGILVKPKMYMADGMVRCKGVHDLDKLKFMRMLADKKASVNRFVKFKEANRRNLSYNEKITFEKNLDLEDNKRAWKHKFDFTKTEDSTALVM